MPPFQDMRLRSIRRYFQDQPELAQLPSAELDRRAIALDEQMMEAFSELQDDLTNLVCSTTNRQTHEERMQRLATGMLESWNSVLNQFLPPITSPELED